MQHDKNQSQNSRKAKLSVRLEYEHYNLIEDAAEREGLEISSFIIMLLVRAHILPDSYLKKIRRRPIPFYNELHKLLGTINKIGGNCKQMADALPNAAGLRSAHAAINRAAEAVTDALHGKPVTAQINLATFETKLTDQGYAFNDIVRSINMGRPQLSGLRAVLAAMSDTADAITVALTDEPIACEAEESKAASGEIRATMKKSAKASTKRQKGDA